MRLLPKFDVCRNWIILTCVLYSASILIEFCPKAFRYVHVHVICDLSFRQNSCGVLAEQLVSRLISPEMPDNEINSLCDKHHKVSLILP